MTTPLAHGYPDWTRQTPASDVLFLRESGSSSTGGVSRGPFFVGATPAVGISFLSVGTGHQVHLDFYADQGANQYLATQSLDFARDGSQFLGAIRALGPWVKITVTPFVNGFTFNLAAWSAPTPGTIFGHATAAVLVSASQAVGIGVNTVLTVDRLHPGVAHLYAAQRAGTYDCNVYSVDFAGVKTILQRRQMAAGTFFSEMIALGSGTPQVELNNTSGAGQVIDVFLVAVPNLTG